MSFVKAEKSKKRRLIVGIEGLEKVGKSSLALSAPGPIGYINIDIGDEGVIDKFIDKKEIEVSNFRMPIQEDGDAEINRVWEQLRVDYEEGLDMFRTLIVDTATEMWDILRLAKLKKLLQVPAHKYVEVNGIYREMIRKAYDSECNLILIHKQKKQYVEVDGKGQWSGAYERAGFGDTGFMTQINVLCTREGSDFKLKILDSRHNPEANGLVLEHPMNTFPYLAATVTDTEPDEWE